MTEALLKWPSEVGTMIVDRLNVDLPALPGDDFRSDSVCYGDRNPPWFPFVTVEVVDLQIDVRFVSRTNRNFAAYLMVYYGKYGDQEATRVAADQCAETVCDTLNAAGPQWPNGLGSQRLVKSWVTRLQPGYARRDNALMYVSRITWEALSQSPL